LKKLTLLLAFCVLSVAARTANAQQLDVALGFGTMTATSGPVDLAGGNIVSQRGGLFPSISADVLFLHHHQIGVQGEVSWRAGQNLYADTLPFRPILYDFNGIWAPRVGKRVQPELMLGFGGEDLRFYGQVNCTFVGCTDYVSSNHLTGHFGAGVRLYVWHNVFVRPEAHVYEIHNNNEFPSSNTNRFAISIGYSLKPGF
jgi:Outer membrane protein beta-barrel domain